MTKVQVARILRVAQTLQAAYPPCLVFAASPIGLESIRSV